MLPKANEHRLADSLIEMFAVFFHHWALLLQRHTIVKVFPDSLFT